MSYIVVCTEGVALRNTPNFEDRNQTAAGPTVGEQLQGSVVEGANALYYLQTSRGYVPFYKKDGSVVLGPAEQVASYQVVAPRGVGYRKTGSFDDRKPGNGPTAGAIVMGIKSVGGDQIEYLQTSSGFLPIAGHDRVPLLAPMPPGTVPGQQPQHQQAPAPFKPPVPAGVTYGQQPQQYGQQPQQSQYGQPPQQYGQQPQQSQYGAPPQPSYGAPAAAAPAYGAPSQNPGYAPNAVGYNAQPVPVAAPAPPQNSGKAAQAQQAFMRFDTDRSGTIECNEFMNAMAMLGNQMAPADAQCIFMLVDGDGDGRVTLNEFTQHWVMNH